MYAPTILMPRLSLSCRCISTFRGGPQELAGDCRSNDCCCLRGDISGFENACCPGLEVTAAVVAAALAVAVPSSGARGPGAEGVEAFEVERPPSTLLGGDCSPEEAWPGCTSVELWGEKGTEMSTVSGHLVQLTWPERQKCKSRKLLGRGQNTEITQKLYATLY